MCSRSSSAMHFGSSSMGNEIIKTVIQQLEPLRARVGARKLVLPALLLLLYPLTGMLRRKGRVPAAAVTKGVALLLLPAAMAGAWGTHLVVAAARRWAQFR